MQTNLPLNGTNENANELPGAVGSPTPPALPLSPAIAAFRQRADQESDFRRLMSMGENPLEYQRLMESLMLDLEPRPGLETHLVEQIGETFWRMRRAQFMRDGLALRKIQSSLTSEDITATLRASQAAEILEPFELLTDALARRGQSPTAEEIDRFVESRRRDTSPPMQEFIELLQALKGPLETGERRSARKKLRAQLKVLMEPYFVVAWQATARSNNVQSQENLTALGVPDEEDARIVQQLEDSHLLRLWRLTNTLAKVRQGVLHKKVFYDQSRNVIENKGNENNMSE